MLGRHSRADPDRGWRITPLGVVFLTAVPALVIVGFATGSGILLAVAVVFALIIAGGYFTSGPPAPWRVREDSGRGEQFDSLGNEITPPDDE